MPKLTWPAVALSGALLLAACGENAVADPDADAATPEATEPAAPVATPDGAGLFRSTWPDTDFSNRTVDLAEIKSGGVGIDGIPPLDAPGTTSIESPRAGVANFGSVSEVNYEANLPVAFIEIDGEAKAYPLHILTWHEIVNDVVGETPIAMTFCPLCNSALAFDRRVDEQVLDFGVSGLLRHSDLVMWDRQTHSWWQQASGEGIVGELAGVRLRILGAGIISYGDFRARFPDGLVLTEDTGHGRSYGLNPYRGYDDIGGFPFLFDGELDDRLPAMERVVTLGTTDDGMAVPFSALPEQPVVEVTVGGQDVVVFWAPGTASALDHENIGASDDIGSAIAYSPLVDGERLRFEAEEPGRFRDVQTGSTWDITGQAIDGPLAGTQLDVALHTNMFWFAWAAFAPNTQIWTQ